jgi:prepilin-type N-terminal cleavage/methylation domain-containing protein
MLQNMLTRARKAREGEGGFTLIELLIVIVILGVLAGIVVFSVRGITDRGEASACKSEVATVQTAVESYYAQTGGYPTATSDLTSGNHQFLHSTPKYVTVGAGGALSYTAAGTAVGAANCPIG